MHDDIENKMSEEVTYFLWIASSETVVNEIQQ